MTGTPLESLQNQTFKKQQKVLQNPRYRQETGLVWVEGPKNVTSLPAENVHALFVGPNAPNNHWPISPYLVDATLTGRMFQADSPQEVGALVSWHPQNIEDLNWSQGVLALDSIRDPGNAGSLIRTAAGLNLGGVIFLNSVDPSNPKVIRSSAGTFFTIPIINDLNIQELINQVNTQNGHIYIADAHGSSGLNQISAPWILVIGSESHGPSPEWSGTRFSISLNSQVESLNAAAAGSIAMAKFKGVI